MEQVTNYLIQFLVWLTVKAGASVTAEIRYPWYPNYTGLEYHNSFCNRDCHEPRLQGEVIRNPVCFPCSCSVSCKIYGTCCPSYEPAWAQNIFDAVDAVRESHLHVSDVHLFQNSALWQDFERFNCVYLDRNYDHLLVVDACPDSEKNTGLHDLCTRNLTDTVKGYTPVVNAHTGVAYRNIYCYQCNDEYYIEASADGQYADHPGAFEPQSNDDLPDNVSSWTLEISCTHYQTLYHLTSEDELLQHALKEDYICDVGLNPPEGVPLPETCLPSWYNYKEPYFYTSCQNTDPRILWYCLHIRHPAFRTTFRGHNLFCMLCEGQIPSKEFQTLTTSIMPTAPIVDFNTKKTEATKHTGVTPVPMIPPIALLLGLTNKYTSHENSPLCSNTTWLNEKGECQDAMCSAGKQSDHNATCVSALKDIRGLGYTLSMTLVPEKTNVSISVSAAMDVKNGIYQRLMDVSPEIDLQINITVLHALADSDDSTGVLHHLTFTSHIIASEITPRDEFELSLLSVVKSDWEINLTQTEDTPLRLTPKLLGMEFSRWHNDYIMPNITEVHYVSVPHQTENNSAWGNFGSFKTVFIPFAPGKTTNTYETNFEKTKLMDAAELNGMKVYNFEDEVSGIVHTTLWKLKHLFIDVTHSLICPFVVVNVSMISMEDGNTVVSFLYRDWNITVSDASEISLVDGKLCICLDLFKNLTRSFRTKATEDPLLTVQYYFEIVCVSLSVMCLLMSFVTYCVFPSLRSLPGLNNMSLCITLATAHICLLITVKYGVYGHLQSGYCTFHAVCLHYFWLAAILWMSACCVHMYRVFTCRGTKFTNSTSDKRRHLHYCVYAFGTPVFIIILTVILSLALTSGTSNGYDNMTCFLDTRTSILTVALSLLAPLCFMVISNSVLFFLTIREIFHVSNLQKDMRRGERHGVMTYAKLSTLTGIFCIVCVVAVQLQSPVLNLLTSPFMALQGVFIFFSFTFTKRVGKLYSDLFGCWQGTSWSRAKSTDDDKSVKTATVSCDSKRQTNANSATNITRI